MSPEAVAHVLSRLAKGELSVAEATETLRMLPYQDLEYARVDHHRELRQGAPEVIFGAGKTLEQVRGITAALLAHDANVLCTRIAPDIGTALCEIFPTALHDAVARTITLLPHPPAPLGKIGIVCAGTSDLPVAREALVCAQFYGAEAQLWADVGVAGLHRLLETIPNLRKVDVVIVVAGMEGALPSVVGGLIAAPVIAVPTSVGYGTNLGGLTTLLAMLSSCAQGVTVVNIDNGFGAAAAAHRILHPQRLNK